MREHRLSATVVLVGGLATVFAHLILNTFFQQYADAISDIFNGFLAIVAFWACIDRSRRCTGMRRSWQIVSVSFALWVVATLIAAWSEYIAHQSLLIATLDHFFYFFYGVPLLLAIAAPDEDESVAAFFWLDGLQVIGLGYLAYMAFFGVAPLPGEHLHPIGLNRLVAIFDYENIVLLSLATARLLSSAPRSPERRFLKILYAYLWAFSICVGINNHVFAAYSVSGPIDAVLDLPFILLVYLAMRVPTSSARDIKQQARTPMTQLAENARPGLMGLAIILLSGWIARDHFYTAVAVVFGAFVIFGIRSALLQSRYLQMQLALEQARDRLQEIALQDGLTGIANRRSFDQRLQQEWNRSRRNRKPLSLLLIDIDHFKKLNDTYGHLAGDECLKQVAQTLRAVLGRPGDLLARYGGEEFVALLPDTDEFGARNVALRIQAVLRETPPISVLNSQVTVSIGASTREVGDVFEPYDLVHSADVALYQAKQSGRNCVEFMALQGV